MPSWGVLSGCSRPERSCSKQLDWQKAGGSPQGDGHSSYKAFWLVGLNYGGAPSQTQVKGAAVEASMEPLNAVLHAIEALDLLLNPNGHQQKTRSDSLTYLPRVFILDYQAKKMEKA